jgi:hypothetical protein
MYPVMPALRQPEPGAAGAGRAEARQSLSSYYSADSSARSVGFAAELFGCSSQVRSPPTFAPVRGPTPSVSGTRRDAVLGRQAPDVVVAAAWSRGHPRWSPTRTTAIGWAYCGSVSHGNNIQVSWLTSVTKVSTTGRPAGLA